MGLLDRECFYIHETFFAVDGYCVLEEREGGWIAFIRAINLAWDFLWYEGKKNKGLCNAERLECHINSIDWPSCSLDLNPIENIWRIA
jgi:hypothetical protein